MLRFNVIAFTHHSIGVEEIGKFHLENDEVVEKMDHLKEQMMFSYVSLAMTNWCDCAIRVIAMVNRTHYSKVDMSK